MTIYDFMINELTKRSMPAQDARIIMYVIVNDQSFAFGTMENRWGEPANAYPDLQTTWHSVREKALVYIEENYPMALFKPMFFDLQALEQFKKEFGFDEWQEKRNNPPSNTMTDAKQNEGHESGNKVEETGVQYTIINSSESYSAQYIKEWCEYQVWYKTEHAFEAGEIFDQFWGIDTDCNFTPNPRVFYFVWYEKNHKGFKEARLERDLEKTP
ncbi:hypothetical protein ACFVS2_25745 [Brevibacillus sp. NPDC058079]|uniref:hypothetical protein n=1 Tax=Brevibacillus sp. NPDC058079 TaxID=3346330 RepID=UPI0036E6EFCD